MREMLENLEQTYSKPQTSFTMKLSCPISSSTFHSSLDFKDIYPLKEAITQIFCVLELVCSSLLVLKISSDGNLK